MINHLAKEKTTEQSSMNNKTLADICTVVGSFLFFINSDQASQSTFDFTCSNSSNEKSTTPVTRKSIDESGYNYRNSYFFFLNKNT